MNPRITQAAIIVFVVFFMLFHAPVVEIMNRNVLILGVPSALLYFMLLWLLLILLTWWVTSKFKDRDHGD